MRSPDPRPRLVWLLCALAALALFAAVAAGDAQGFANGRASASDLSPIYMPGNTANLAKPAAAGWNSMRLCSLRSGVDLYPSQSSTRPAQTAYRTFSQQQALWALYKSGRGALAAVPGRSNHGVGRAVDTPTPRGQAWIRAHGRAAGAWAKVEAFSEAWHYNYVGGFGRPDPGTNVTSPHLENGSGGACQAPFVRELQQRLGQPAAKVPGPRISADGAYGKATHDAVVRYQRRYRGLADTGKVGSATWYQLRKDTRGVNPTPAPQSRTGTAKPVGGQDVRSIQGLLNARLREYGSATRVATDGVFGPRTAAAVREFQQRRGLKPATGVVGPRTRAALAKALPKARPQSRSPLAKGIDVSEHNGSISWTGPVRAGYHFACAKSGEGITYTDPRWSKARWDQMGQAGLVKCSYHFARPQPGRSGRSEALGFIQRVRSVGGIVTEKGKPPRLQRGVLPLVLDLESTRLSLPATQRWAADFCATVQSATRRGCILYTARWFYGNTPQPARAGALWVANYTSGPRPLLPGAWRSWLLWQWSDHGSVAGVGGGVDLNRCTCNLAQLRRMAGLSPTPANTKAVRE